MADIIGNSGDNVLFGTPADDNIYGIDGDDVLFGGDGNDFIDGGNGRDVVDAGAGNDRVSGGTGNDTLYGNDSDDTLLGGDSDDTLLGGNGDDTLLGGNGNDRLDGQAGNDALVGELGDDIYTVSDRGDVINEAPDAGVDTVRAFTSYRLSRNLENLTLVGDAAINGRGNGSNNRLEGNSAANRLIGNGGNDLLIGNGGRDRLVGDDGKDTLFGDRGSDVLTGGKGADRFAFDSSDQRTDRITDFAGEDSFYLSRNGFDRRLGRGTLSSSEFRAGASASSRDQRFIYDPNRGIFFFDRDGSGSIRQIPIAFMTKGLNLTARNVTIF